MTGKEPTNSASNPLARALDRWDSEGGASRPVSEDTRGKQIALAEEEEHILQCLGAAAIMLWNDLPRDTQRQLFEHAISMGEPRHSVQLKEQIARFLHNHKNRER